MSKKKLLKLSGEKYGLKTPLGEVILDAGYENFKMMTSEELKNGDKVVAQQNGMCGVLITGTPVKWIIEPEYDNIGYPNNSTFVVKGDEWEVIDENDQFTEEEDDAYYMPYDH